jgi:transketolase
MTITPASLMTIAKNLRREILEIAYKTGKGHLGGTFSIVDVLVTLYHGGFLNYSGKVPFGDRLLMGKGHASLALYCILKNLGLLPKTMLATYGEDGGLGVQLDVKTNPYISYNTGSLGHVVGVGAGMALASKLQNSKRRIYVIVGDGECEEGSVWESLQFAVDHSLDNLIVIVDQNALSVTEKVETSSLANKMVAFGCEVLIIDGHNFIQLDRTFNYVSGNKLTPFEEERFRMKKPIVVIAKTTKGKGVSFMENVPKWHQAVLTPDEFEIAKEELEM